jgi:hypothetical protein
LCSRHNLEAGPPDPGLHETPLFVKRMCSLGE